MQVMKSLVKQRQKAAELFRQGGRPELAEKEEAESRLIESYLPAAPSEEEVEAAIAAALAETSAASVKQIGLGMAGAGLRSARQSMSEGSSSPLGIAADFVLIVVAGLLGGSAGPRSSHAATGRLRRRWRACRSLHGRADRGSGSRH